MNYIHYDTEYNQLNYGCLIFRTFLFLIFRKCTVMNLKIKWHHAATLLLNGSEKLICKYECICACGYKHTHINMHMEREKRIKINEM